VEDLRPGDTLVIWMIDRLGRNLRDLIDIVNTLETSGVGVQSWTNGHRGHHHRTRQAGVRHVRVDGRLLCYLERTLIAERAAAARQAARIRGRQVGRPPSLTGEQVGMTVRMRASGESVGDICRTFGIGRSTLYRLWPTGGDIAPADSVERLASPR
jgi:DNA invertase Pin-like site-specific DNA recombinase